MGYVDKEKKRLKTEGDYCACLTEDGWCKLVLACGEEQLSATCTIFPRTVRKHGDISEATVELVCPVVAGYLLDPDPIEFGLEETEMSGTPEEIDYQTYDSLSLARNYLVDLIQESPYRFSAGKLYIALSALYKIRELYGGQSLRKEDVIAVLEPYDHPEVRQEVYAKCGMLSSQYEVKSILLQNLLVQFRYLIQCNLAEVLDQDPELMGNLDQWIADRELLTEDVTGAAQYLAEEYPAMQDNFLVYSLFLEWINMNAEIFGQNLCSRIVELALIRIFAMSLWKQQGRVDRETFEALIASVDRKISHGSEFLKRLYEFIAEIGKDSLANILMIVI